MRCPENYHIIIKNKALAVITTFYKNVGKHNVDRYGEEEIQKLIRNNIKSISSINHTKLISDPILDKWKGLGRVDIGQWNFAIDIKGNKVTVVDACHQQNMTNDRTIAEMFETDLNTPVQRITDITFPPAHDNRHFIRCKIDGEQHFMKEIPKKHQHQYKNGELTKYQLPEKCYAKELNENRFTLDRFLNKGRKI